MESFPNALFSAIQPIGKNAIAKMFKDLAGILDIPAEKFSGHALRRECISTMVNNDVPILEAMATARHASVSASIPYHKTSC